MTEHEWLASADPQNMLHDVGFKDNRAWKPLISRAPDRKLRLFARACWGQMSEWRVSDEMPSDAEIAAALYSGIEPEQAACLLRDIIGNPFQPVNLLWKEDCRRCNVASNPPLQTRLPNGGRCGGCGRPWTCPWLTSTVLDIANTIYRERRFDDMPILGDALEEAGCDNEDVLMHCRGMERCFMCGGDGLIDHDHGGTYPWGEPITIQQPCPECDRTGWLPLRGPHVRGCWVLDLVLGL